MNFVFQIDLFNLIGGSWPPAPRAPQCADYGAAPRTRHHTMQRSHERNKSANLINHLAPERRRTRVIVPVKEQPQDKMVHEARKVETGLLIGKFIK